MSLLCVSTMASPLVAVNSSVEVDGFKVVLLLDRSPSAASKRAGNEYLIDKFALSLRNQIVGLAAFHEVPVYFGAANFGNDIGDSEPLEQVKEGLLPRLPKREVIPYTDFRPALTFALKQLQREEINNQDDEHTQRLVLLITDSEPWLPNAHRMSERDKTMYFSEFADPANPTLRPVSESIAEIQRLGGEVVVIAVGDHELDAKLWRAYLPSNNYISSREFPDPLRRSRGLFQEFIDRAPQLSVTPPTLTTNTTPPVHPEKLPRTTSENNASGRRVAILATIAALVLAAIMALQLRQLRRKEEKESLLDPKLAEARALAQDDSTKKEAKEKYTTLLDEEVEINQRARHHAETVSRVQFSRIIGEMMTQLCQEVDEERSLMTELLNKDNLPGFADGFAHFLLHRWTRDPSILLTEFDLLRTQSGGTRVLASLIPPEFALDSGAKPPFLPMLRGLAQAAIDLEKVAEVLS
jgi:hypothetical protein